MYNSVIAGYVTCDKQTAQGLDQAKDVLDHMISSHESNLRHIARPNTTSFARVMAVLARRGENTTCLEELLAKMEGLHQRRKNTPRSSPEADLVANVVPNIVIYNFLLKAYAKRNDDEAVQSSMKLLRKIEKEPGLKADDVTTSYIEQLQNGKQGLRGALSTKDNKPAGPRVTQFDVDNLKLDELSLQELTAKSFSSIMNGEFAFVHTSLGHNLSNQRLIFVDASTSQPIRICNSRKSRSCRKRCCTTTQAGRYAQLWQDTFQTRYVSLEV